MKKSSVLALIAYLLLTALLTWPAALHLTDGIPGDGFDGWQNYWNLWWVRQALLEKGVNPFFTFLVDAPNGVSLLFHTLNIFNGLWTLPIQLNFGLAVAYNSVVFASFALAGLGGYLLALHTLAQLFPGRAGLRGAAFVGGLIFTMSPFHMAHLLGHMQVFSMIWPPFYILWLVRTLDPWRSPTDPLPPRPWRNAALCSLFLILATLVDWYHTLYLLMFTGLLLLWVLWRNRGAVRPVGPIPANPFFRPLAQVALVGAGFALVLWPLLLPMMRNAANRPDLDTGLFQNTTLSADLLAFFVPSELHPLWGNWAAALADNFTTTTSERTIFAGFTALALGVLALVWGRRQSAVRFWLLVLAAFVLMALGPFLHIGGNIVTVGNWQLPLPYLALYYTVPFINLTRSLSRYDLMVMLALGVLASVGLVYLTAKLRLARPWIPALAAAVLVCVEFVAAPYPVSKIDTPQFYSDLKSEAGDFVIAELPMNWDRPTPLLHQTEHGKRLLTAYTSRDNPLQLAGRTPVLQQWRNLGPDIINQPPAEIAPTIFFDFNLRYVVLDYWQMPPGPERDATEQAVAAALPNAAPVVDDGRLKVYRTPPKTQTRSYLSLGEGWGNRQVEGDQVWREFAPTAELWLHHADENSPAHLTLTAASGSSPQSISVWVGDSLAGEFEVGSSPVQVALPLPPQLPPLVRLQLVTGEPDTPVRVFQTGLEF